MGLRQLGSHFGKLQGCGTYFTDQTAKPSIRNAITAGLHVNGYHFARFTTETGAKAEAQMAARSALKAGLGKSSVIVLDFEATNSGWNQNSKIVKAWINEVHRMAILRQTSIRWAAGLIRYH
ncbi:GH25 family lysozyme [Levilactobacillus brevis]|uniref:GH25 family lysozyme n=1 Tax=Levilactobacillus brevis TaxID=1580 RepID=UPI001CDBA9AA|nr:GH25 family lysozyme [Levilactobacillus brevis]